MSKSQEIYEAVEALLAASEGLDKQKAFEVVATERGVKPSNVAGAYYRHAKKIEAPLEPRKRRARSGPKAPTRMVGGAIVPEREAIITNDLPPALAAAVNEIVREIVRLQAERNAQAELIAEMRRLAS